MMHSISKFIEKFLFGLWECSGNIYLRMAPKQQNIPTIVYWCSGMHIKKLWGGMLSVIAIIHCGNSMSFQSKFVGDPLRIQQNSVYMEYLWSHEVTQNFSFIRCMASRLELLKLPNFLRFWLYPLLFIPLYLCHFWSDFNTKGTVLEHKWAFI